MKKLLSAIIAVILFAAASAVSHAQTTVYTIGSGSCGNPRATVWPQLWCYSVPLTLAGKTTPTANMSLDANTDAEWIALPFSTHLALIKATNVVSWGAYPPYVPVPTEVVFTLQADDQSFVGTADVDLTCEIGKATRYTYGTVCQTTGGRLTIIAH